MKGLLKIDTLLSTKNYITSNELTLEQLILFDTPINIQIPLYQRLYVWDVEEIKLFIEDVSDAYISGKDFYYIGNMMFANTKNGDNIQIDLIDGQQRFTTLWLTSILLKSYSKNLTEFAFINDEPRLNFTSRDEVNEFFKSLLNIKINLLNNSNLSFNQNNPSLEPIVNGLLNIFNFIKEVSVNNEWSKNDLCAFSDFIFKKLQMVQTTVPMDNDLNQIFESLNSGGKQLVNHQILKSRFLKVLKKDNDLKNEIDSLVYKWDSASNMNLYLERSVYNLTNATWEDVIKKDVWRMDKYSFLSKEYFQFTEFSTHSIPPISLQTILDNSNDNEIKESKIGKKQQDSVKSIVSFSQFLLHSLRVFYLQKGISKLIPVDSKNLLLYFDIEKNLFSESKVIKEFINLMFDLRFLFDTFIVKWSTEDGESESLLINKCYFNQSNKSYSVRREYLEGNKQLALVQSVLYITQESKTQYWITPFLNYLYKRYITLGITESYDDAIKNAVFFTENLDNFFYCQNNSLDMSTLSFKDFTNDFKVNAGDYKYVRSNLKSLNGTNFFRYWFYKTEYLLWKYKEDFEYDVSSDEFHLWKNYKITFKTSIEHIFPQSKSGFETKIDKKDFEKIDNPILKDYFGNLVLLSVSENSEYGKADVDDKKTKYKLKLNNQYIDSLKSSLIFNLVDKELDGVQKGIWNYSKAKYHMRNQILKIHKKHLRNNLCPTNTQKINS
ncbi:DUF262 domain-containing protein [Chryseobacterium sp. Leaf201]|uniref:DUF262 domain-containing protein n=1 Tax=Chryseobacterium sp. Leaf201 TaxID=1735672 RepID=UPI0006F827DA|nr:DUF262 domain-containing protein [Chryseobacterium sp. Leaf201]KQM31814.1 hypothetical protein ASE55_16735 [Chryseobacterium sp. Leaf201]